MKSWMQYRKFTIFTVVCISSHSAISIGFEQQYYTFIEPPFEEEYHIFLATEDGRKSEQMFMVSTVMVPVDDSDFYEQATVGEDFIAKDVFRQILFEPFIQRVQYNFTLLSDNVTEVKEAFSVQCFVSMGNESLSPNHLPHQATIVIIDSESEFKLYITAS